MPVGVLSISEELQFALIPENPITCNFHFNCLSSLILFGGGMTVESCSTSFKLFYNVCAERVIIGILNP